jgi:hypothetical protein
LSLKTADGSRATRRARLLGPYCAGHQQVPGKRGRPVVGDQLGLRGDGTEHEGMEFRLAKALDHLQPGAAALATVDFNRADSQHLAYPAAATRPDNRVVLGGERDHRFVRLDQAAELLTLGLDYGTAQLGAQYPGDVA